MQFELVSIFVETFTHTAGMSGQDKHRKCIARLSDDAGDVRPGSAGVRA